MSSKRWFSAFVMAVAMVATAAQGQTSQGRILGTIKDQSGAVVSGARVTITNSATGVSRSVVTTSSGEYSAPDVDPGTYAIAAEARGFKKALSTVIVEVSREVRADLRLQPGDVTQTVEVTAEGALADTTDTTLNGVLSNKAINELPLQGRDFQNLLPLHPGVQRTPGGGFHSVTSNGNRPDDNNFYIDGADDNDAYYGETVVNDAGISGTPASFLPLDAIQEFNTQEGPGADYGVKPGVVVNMGIKSGTNDIHGSAYYFSRNSAVDARNYFDPAPSPVSALILHQFGASIGGPIRKEKWFYFVNYEGIRDKVGNPGVTYSPVTTSLASTYGGISNSDGSPTSAPDFSVPDAIAYYGDPNNVAYCQANVGGPCAVSPLSVQLSQLFLPNPGFTLQAADPAAINFNFNNVNRGDNLVAKTDYTLDDHDTFSARFIYSNSNQTEEDTHALRPQWLSTTSPITQVFGVNWTHTVNAHWVNDARFSYNRFNEAIYPADHKVNPAAYGLNTGVTNPMLFGFPRINPGLDQFNYMGGNSSWPLATTPSQAESVSDTVSYTAGKHTIQFGGNFRYGSVDYFRAGYGRGRVDFSSLLDFIAGNVDRWRFLYGDPGRHVSQRAVGFFVQDSFRVTPRVTINAGLRYDITNPIKDSHNLLANYLPSQGIVQVGQGISQPYPTNYNNISPRLGIAWDARGNGKTVLRASSGIIFEQPTIRTFMFNGGGLNLNPSGIPYVDENGNTVQPRGTINSFLVVSSDSSQINWSQAGPIFPAAAGGSCSLSSQCSVFGVDQHLKTPYVINWNFNIQQEIAPQTLLQIAYVAQHGVKLYSVADINQVDPNSPLESDPNNANFCDHCEQYGRPLVTNCPTTSLNGGGLGNGGSCFPFIGSLQQLSNHSSSNYNSLQVTLTKRFSHGLYLLGGYTWAHAIDTATTNLAGVPPNSLNYNSERGNGDYDIRNRFTLSLAYEFPSRKTKWQMLEGWEVTTVAMLEGGEPFTLYDGNDDISLTGEFNDRWNISGPAKNIHWSPTTPLPYIDPSQFQTTLVDPVNMIYQVTGGATPAAQLCFNQALATGGQNAADQLAGNSVYNTNFSYIYGFYSTGNGGCYVSGNTVITPPAPGAQGNMGRNIFRGPSFRNWDFSIAKSFRLGERAHLQLRGEFFNILNHSNFDVFSMNTDLSSPSTVGTVVFTPDVAASNPVIGSGGSRHIQVAAKVIW